MNGGSRLGDRTLSTPRYLVGFDPKRIPHYFADVLIVGGGVAGLRAALAVNPSLSTIVVTKDALGESNSNYAQGGIASVTAPDDSFQDHIQDTLTAGGALCDRRIVETVVRAAPELIAELISWGTEFDSDHGELQLGREGGHAHHRILHAMGDATGREIMRALHSRARGARNVSLWQHTFTLDLLVHEGLCRGALLWNAGHGRTL
ncbi:MAG TPA: FAD-binding protein, partial [Pirellulaceae bacterium]